MIRFWPNLWIYDLSLVILRPWINESITRLNSYYVISTLYAIFDKNPRWVPAAAASSHLKYRPGLHVHNSLSWTNHPRRLMPLKSHVRLTIRPQWFATIRQAAHSGLRRRREVIRLGDEESDRWSQRCRFRLLSPSKRNNNSRNSYTSKNTTFSSDYHLLLVAALQ